MSLSLLRALPRSLHSVRALLALVLLSAPGLLWAAKGPPNIIVFLADDLGWADVGYHGGNIATPAIDSLAAEGVRMERFYATPICSPTRAALMTGRDALKLGIAYDQLHPWYNGGLPPDEYLMAEAFRDAGYQTAMVGKWHLGHTQQHQLPNAQGFEDFYGHLHTNTDFFTHKRENGHDLQHNGTSVFEDGTYLTHIEAREAVRFIKQRDKDKPFFLYVPFTAPHSPMQAPQATIDKYKDQPRKNSRNIYAAMVDEMDQAVGQVLATLDDEKLTKKTIVVFVSDNGGSTSFGGQNQPYRGQKGQTFEGGIRVPAVIRWPKQLDAGGVLEQTMSIMDLYPTLAAAAGVEYSTPRGQDGQNMWPALAEGEAVPRQQPLFFVSEIPIPGMIFTAVIDGNWKLVQMIREGQTSMQVNTMLFDLATDSYEKTNLAEELPEQAAKMAEMIRAWRAQHPLAGTRGTLVPHPGWIPPKDWAESAQASELAQPKWTNELPFSNELIKAIGDRGVLVDEETRKALLEQEQQRKKEWGQ